MLQHPLTLMHQIGRPRRIRTSTGFTPRVSKTRMSRQFHQQPTEIKFGTVLLLPNWKSGRYLVNAPRRRRLGPKRFCVNAEMFGPNHLGSLRTGSYPDTFTSLLQHRTAREPIQPRRAYGFVPSTDIFKMARPRRIKLPFSDRQSGVLSLDDDLIKWLRR